MKVESNGMIQECFSEGGFSRNRYFHGQLLTSADMQAEQDYHLNKRRLLLRCLFGSRIVCGLVVQVEEGRIVITHGLALDCLGREIYVPNTENITLPDKGGDHFLTISYCEVPINPVPIISEPSNHNEEDYTRVREGFILSWSAKNPLAGHDWREGAWTTCGKSHPFVLAHIEIRGDRIHLNEKLAKRVGEGRTRWC